MCGEASVTIVAARFPGSPWWTAFLLFQRLQAVTANTSMSIALSFSNPEATFKFASILQQSPPLFLIIFTVKSTTTVKTKNNSGSTEKSQLRNIKVLSSCSKIISFLKPFLVSHSFLNKLFFLFY